MPDVPAGATRVMYETYDGDTHDLFGRDPIAPEDPRDIPPIRVAVNEGERVELVVWWDGGLTVAPPRIELEPGSEAPGLRVLDLEADGDEWLLTIEGTAGRAYEVDLFGTAVTAAVVDGGARVRAMSGDTGRAAEGNTRFSVEIPDAEGRHQVTLRLTPRR